jgi:hypothetical protein
LILLKVIADACAIDLPAYFKPRTVFTTRHAGEEFDYQVHIFIKRNDHKRRVPVLHDGLNYATVRKWLNELNKKSGKARPDPVGFANFKTIIFRHGLDL